MSSKHSLETVQVIGKVFDGAGPVGQISPERVVQEIIALGREWVEVHQTELTKREQIRADRDVELDEIKARRKLFLTYLDRSFDERAVMFDALFARLDQAFQGDPAAVGPVLASITALAAKSPFADLHNPALVKAKLDDTDAEWPV